MKAAVYRHFSASGELLYIGSSVNVLSRTSTHSRDASWFGEVAIITLQHFDKIEEARYAEAHAIKTEYPRENRTYMPRDLRRPRRVVPEVSTDPHPQLDAIKTEYKVGPRSLISFLNLGIEEINGIIASGRKLTDEEITDLKWRIPTTYKRLARIGLTKTNSIGDK